MGNTISSIVCEKCHRIYTNQYYKWCKPCQMNVLNQTSSENEKIDNLTQEMRLRINHPQDIVFEWISYNQFSDIEIIAEHKFVKLSSAIWRDGPLSYRKIEGKFRYTRNENNMKVNFKCFNNSQNITNEFLNKV